MQIVLLTSLIMMAFSLHSVTGQSIMLEKESGVISRLIGEDQHGNKVKFQPPEEKPLVLFFLPKTDSRNEAELYMSNVTNFFENLGEHKNEFINRILVVEPIRSGPLVNRIFRSKLSNKSFTVMRDLDGKITDKVNDQAYMIMAWVVGKNGEIIYITTEPFMESTNRELRKIIEDITNKGPQN